MVPAQPSDFSCLLAKVGLGISDAFPTTTPGAGAIISIPLPAESDNQRRNLTAYSRPLVAATPFNDGAQAWATTAGEGSVVAIPGVEPGKREGFFTVAVVALLGGLIHRTVARDSFPPYLGIRLLAFHNNCTHICLLSFGVGLSDVWGWTSYFLLLEYCLPPLLLFNLFSLK